MNAYRISPLKYPWPAVFYIIAVLAAIGLQRITPFTLAEHRLLLLKLFGSAVALFALYLIAWASITLSRQGAALFSANPARLVISGPFRHSRNPIYLGYTLLTFGIGLFLDDGWILVGALFAAAATHLYVIRKEEMHLLARFGYEFERYCRRTRAWI